MGLSCVDRPTTDTIMADDEQALAEKKRKRTFRKFTYRGVDLDQLLDMSLDQLADIFPCRQRRRLNRGLKRKPLALIKRLRKAKKEAGPLEKPEVVRHYLGEFSITYKPVKHGRPGIGATHSSK